MRRIVRAKGLRPLAAIIPFLVAAGCGASPPHGAAGAIGPAARQTIGVAGGVLSSANGDVRLDVPAGAVDHDIALTIEPLSAPPAGSVGTVFEIGPSGTTFRVPVRLTFAPAPAEATELDQLAVAVFQNGAWERLDGQASDPVARTVSATTTHLSIYGVVRGCAVGAVCDPNPAPFILSRWWEFTTQYPGSAETRFGGPVREGRVASDVIDFGPQILSPPGGSDVARGMVFSNETGGTYWALAEAPRGGEHGASGGESVLHQVQYFRKQSAGAWLRLRVTSVVLEAIDTNGTPCVDAEGSPSCLDRMLAAVAYDVKGEKAHPGGDRVSFFDFHGHALLAGYHGHWFGPVESYGPIVRSPWKDSSFELEQDLEGDGGSHARLRLPAPITIEVPLSSVSVGDEVRLVTNVRTHSHNNRGGESYLGAYFADPVMADGLAITFEGIEPVAGPANPAPAADPPPPAVCPGAPDPAAGTLQLAAAAISAGEQVGRDARVVVTRRGGSRGEVSAVLRSADGSAMAGGDYLPVDTLVRFADGQDGSQVVLVSILDDTAIEPPETFTLTLSDPRGCAALGAQSSAVLAIVDDDRLPDPTYTVGGAVEGLVGGGLVLTSFGADLPIAASGRFAFPVPRLDSESYDVRVKTQPTNPIQLCAVQRGTGRIAGADITDVQVDCQAPPPPGSLDPSFGSGGLVFSSKSGMADGATPLALDGEGGVLVAGGVADSFGLADFALARFTANGQPDLGFGAGGVATTGFGSGYDVARALVIQPDGKIVVVGETSPTAASATIRFALARFLPDGRLDPQFGVGGQVTTSFDASFNRVAGALVQRDGRILVAGTTAVTSAAGRVQITYALARFLPDGTLDPAFGAGGKAAPVVADGARAQSLGILSDGRIVVAGLVGERGGAARYDAAGALDSGFGTSGFVTLDIDSAPALAVQSDDQVIVAGSRPSPATGERDFAILRLGPAGGLDRGFGNQGSATVDFPAASDDDYPGAVALGPGGTIVVVGSTSDRTRPSNVGSDFALARFDATGTLDATFGTGGMEVHDFFGAFDGARGVALAPGGALVVGGSVRNGTTPGFGLLRLRPR